MATIRSVETLEPRRMLTSVAKADHYLVDQNQSLEVPADSGVLANDLGITADAFEATLDIGPKHGILHLADDGSFQYEPERGYIGTDRFTYSLDTGQSISPTATVVLIVQQPEPIRLRPRGDSVVTFNELMYHPMEDDESEWIELYNQMSVNVDLSGWQLEGGVNYAFAPGTVLSSGKYLVIATQPEALAFAFGLDEVLGPWRGRLSNGGEEVRLVNRAGRVMDVLDYQDAGEWHVGADGSGASLAKRLGNAATSVPTSWIASPQTGGSPGVANFGEHKPRHLKLTSPGSRATVHIPQDGTLGTSWTISDFDDSSWTVGNQPVLFDQEAPASAPQADSLRAYWTFDGNFTDSTGNGHTGTPYGTSFVDDFPTPLGRGQSVHLDGEDDFISAVVDISETSYSASLWFRADSENAENPNQLNRGLFSVVTEDLATRASNDRQIYFSNANVTTRVWFIETIRSTDLSLTDGQWHHVVHVLGGDVGGQQIYVDGQLVAEGTKNSSDVFEQTRVNIGFAYNGRNRFYQGWVDDISLWDEALSAETVQALYQGESPLSLRSYRGESGIDVTQAMANIQSSAYLRTEFLANPSLYDQLQLTVRYDDGFVAYLNGAPVSQINAPPTADWNAAAKSPRTRADVFRPRTIDLTPHLDLLRSGRNVLAIHVLNSSVNDDTFFFSGELSAVRREFVPLTVDLRLSEVAAAGVANFSVEITNVGDSTISLEDFVLHSTEGNGKSYVLPRETMSAGEYRTFTSSELGFTPSVRDRLFVYSPDKVQLLDGVALQIHPQARLDNDRRWQVPSLVTPNAVNQFSLHDQIVINEIHYHDMPYHATDSLSFIESPTEWIELFNQGLQPVDLSGWSLTGGIDFTFPTGTVLGAGEYLVVSNDRVALALDFPEIAIVGNFQRSLSNERDMVQLLDQSGNLADEVTYFESGRWPAYADGGGSTLELRNPNADNRHPEAWAASDQTHGSVWQRITYRGVITDDGFSEVSSQGYHEFVFGLLDAGELLIDDISVVEDPSDTHIERIQNGSFQQDVLGSSAELWRISGNHGGVVVRDPYDTKNQVLHVVASGPFESRMNHAETTFANNAQIEVGQEYEVSFRAKWLAGSPQLNTHLFFNHLAETTILEVPRAIGSPGKENSQFVDNMGPTYTGLRHRPVLPEAGESVVVDIVASDPQDVASLTLWYAVNDGAWYSVEMTAVGHGDFQGTIPGQSAASVVNFFVEGADTTDAVSHFPPAGRQSRALYQVQDGLRHNGTLQTFHIIMTPADTALLLEETNLLSNTRLGATVVSDGREVFYDVGVRLRGSVAGRSDELFLSYNVQFDPSHLFRGVHKSVAIDRSGRSTPVTRGQDEILVKHIANHAGVPAMFDDLTHFVAPDPRHTRTALLMLARYGDVFLDSQFEGGADGTVFKLELPYIPETTVAGDPQSPKLPFPYFQPLPSRDLEDLGDNKESYRPHLLIRNNRSADNFSQIIAASKAMSLERDALVQAAAEVIDVDQWARTFAVRSLTGVLDAYTTWIMNHNIAFYVHPADGRVLALPWDWDIAFTLISSGPLIGDFSNASKLLNLPTNRRLVHGHLLDIMNTTFNNEYLDPWIDHYGEFAGQSYREIKPYVAERSDFVRSELPEIVPFQITTSSGQDFDVDRAMATLDGEGWIDVREIRLSGNSQPLELTWTGEDTWQLTLPLSTGPNAVRLEAYDFDGRLVGEDSLTITSTGGQRPLHDGLRVGEVHFNPGPPTVEEHSAGYSNNDDFEFLEIVNIGVETLDLSGAQLVQVDVEGDFQGVAFDFANSSVTTLPAGDRVLIVEDSEAFAFRYGHNQPVAGQWSGRLSNTGELLTLVADGVTIQQFEYRKNWYEQTNGNGPSLELLDPTNPDLDSWNFRESWRASTRAAGSPGTSGLRGDLDGNDVVNAADIDRLHDEIHADTHSSSFDLTEDGEVDQTDLDELVLNILKTKYGDTDLNGTVDELDFATLARNFGSSGASWSMGDNDGDSDVDFQDFVQLTINFD